VHKLKIKKRFQAYGNAGLQGAPCLIGFHTLEQRPVRRTPYYSNSKSNQSLFWIWNWNPRQEVAAKCEAFGNGITGMPAGNPAFFE
jgi:hypothetical protein